jgi:hypothetical protein
MGCRLQPVAHAVWVLSLLQRYNGMTKEDLARHFCDVIVYFAACNLQVTDYRACQLFRSLPAQTLSSQSSHSAVSLLPPWRRPRFMPGPGFWELRFGCM